MTMARRHDDVVIVLDVLVWTYMRRDVAHGRTIAVFDHGNRSGAHLLGGGGGSMATSDIASVGMPRVEAGAGAGAGVWPMPVPACASPSRD